MQLVLMERECKSEVKDLRFFRGEDLRRKTPPARGTANVQATAYNGLFSFNMIAL
jgi:hypothetical protein